MKPIKLTISGLNSFEDTQTIDFEQLSTDGIFGIFGPTGSGKSSIIDAITMSLYGAISRNDGAMNLQCINSSMDKMNLSFTFAVGNANSHFEIRREYRKQGERMTNHKSLLICGEDVIADKFKECNAEIARIIGLSFDDFTRAVVLPQGKFSEFLFLDNKERRKMLENIFHLEAYGTKLRERLSRLVAETKRAIAVSEKGLEQYADVSEQRLFEETERLKTVLHETIELRKQLTEKTELLSKHKRMLEAKTRIVEVQAGLKKNIQSLHALYTLQTKLLKAEYDNAVSGYRQLETTVKALEADKQRLQKERDEINNNSVELKNNLDRLNVPPEVRQGVSEIRLIIEKIGQYRKMLTNKTSDALDKLKKLEADVRVKNELLEEKLKQVEQLKSGNMLQAVSHMLENGKPCPLCGSVDHPSPFVPLEGQATLSNLEKEIKLSSRELNETQMSVSALKAGIAKDEALEKSVRSEIEGLETSLNSLKKSLNLDDYEKAARDIQDKDNKRLEAEKAYNAELKAVSDLTQKLETINESLVKESVKRESIIAAGQESKLLHAQSIEEQKQLPPCDNEALPILNYDLKNTSSLIRKAVDERHRFEAEKEYLNILLQESGDSDIIDITLSSLTTEVEKLNAHMEENTKQSALLAASIEKLKSDIIKQNQLIQEHKKILYESDLQKELSVLLEGNRFVEYIAKGRLLYITKEASKRLKEMSAGRYALELSETEFVIRDDAKGGVRRSPKTLSGGEVFMTSLCLALALSSKIQLSNNSPLEFFFLDEGFGTLDASTLDIVMNTLERLRYERITVGIISHVEELKSRIQRKLILENNGSGTQVAYDL